jgi:hypothetical protein
MYVVQIQYLLPGQQHRESVFLLLDVPGHDIPALVGVQRTRAPLSESDGENLKAVLHILADQAKPRWRTTEKIRAVLPQTPSSESAAEKAKPERESARTGHWRNGASRFADRSGATQKAPRRHLSGSGVGQVYRRRNLKRWCGSWGGRRWRQPGTKWSACAVTGLGRC